MCVNSSMKNIMLSKLNHVMSVHNGGCVRWAAVDSCFGEQGIFLLIAGPTARLVRNLEGEKTQNVEKENKAELMHVALL